ncbi:unnamed protein product [Musa hybrid cultivar]
MEGTVFTPSLEGMKHVKSENGEILTKPFLDVCKHILPVLDKFGAAMAIVKSDIGGNITRLETKYNSDPSKYEYLYSMVQVEVESKTATGSSSCSNGLLWLTRAMDFLVELFRNLLEHADWTMSQVCTDSYSKTLKKWHGWLASSTVTVIYAVHTWAQELTVPHRVSVYNGHKDEEGHVKAPAVHLSNLREIFFTTDNKEPEMQIGFPTDVKHVAHIGWDGPSVGSPSWMKDYHSAPLSSSFGADGRESPPSNSWGSQEFSRGGGIEDSPARQTPEPSRLSAASAEPSPDSPDVAPASTKPRHSRRHQSDGSLPSDSPSRDSADGSRRGRKPRKKDAAGPSDSPAQDMPAIPKQSHRRKNRAAKSKAPASTEEGSTKPAPVAAMPSAGEDHAAQ